MKRFGLILWKLFLQCSIPILLSGTYAYWDYRSVPNPTIAGAFKTGCAAFFFLMWAIALYQRASKQTSDEENWSSVKTDVGAIKGDLAELTKKLSGTPLAASEQTSFFNSAVNEAQQAFQAGYKQAALLAAAVEYEHAIRTFAQRNDLVDPQRTPVMKLVYSLQPIVGPNIFRELSGLWRARNLLVHGGARDQLTEEKSAQLFDSLLWAIGYLSGVQYGGER